MNKDYLLQRYQELAKSLQESLENHTRIKTALDNATSVHNSLAGRVEEAYHLYKEAEKQELEKEESPTKNKAK